MPATRRATGPTRPTGDPIDAWLQVVVTIWSPEDQDCDGFDDDVESYLGTDPLDSCPDEIGVHDAWPLDVNMDMAITVVGDALNFRGRIGAAQGSPEWWQRLDLNADNFITVVPDILYYRGLINTGCT